MRGLLSVILLGTLRKSGPERSNVETSEGEFANPSSSPAILVALVLHQEFVGAKSNKLLGTSFTKRNRLPQWGHFSAPRRAAAPITSTPDHFS